MLEGRLIRVLSSGLLALFLGSLLLQNYASPSLKSRDVFARYLFEPFNLSPRNWGMFTSHVSSAYERRLVYTIANNSQVVEPIKGLNHPFRRTPWNELLERLFSAGYSSNENGRTKFLWFRCRRGYRGETVRRIRFEERFIPIDSLMRGDASLRAYPFQTTLDYECEEVVGK